jgi:hypothetical protein
MRHRPLRNVVTPQGLLAQSWQSLSKDELRHYLMRILETELWADPSPNATPWALNFRLRRRRQRVAERFVRLGGRVSSRLQAITFCMAMLGPASFASWKPNGLRTNLFHKRPNRAFERTRFSARCALSCAAQRDC